MHKLFIFRINFNMQQQSKQSLNQLQDEEFTVNATALKRKKILKQKSTKKNKNTKQKKKIVISSQAIHSLSNLQGENNTTKHKSDEDNSVSTFQSSSSKTNLAITLNPQPTSFLYRLLIKPSYIIICKSNKISGNYGHSTAIFKRPVLEGNYYLEILIKEDRKRQRLIKYPSSVRVGICPHQYNCQTPLGCGESIAYKSVNGSLVRNGQPVAKGQPYKANDIIGILMKISPPHKISDPSKINQGSSVCFFKNGQLICQIKDLKQIFYCFAVSLYNYSQVQILQGPNRFNMEVESKHYFSTLNEKIPYKDLSQNKIFKI